MQRFRTRESACPICSGYDAAHRGQGERCFGYLSSDGKYAHCTRSEHAGSMQPHTGKGGAQTYAHKLEGSCGCGVTHGEASAGQVRQIGESSRAQIVATYDYTDERGKLVYQVVRTNPKGFRQRRPCPNGPKCRGECKLYWNEERKSHSHPEGWIWSLKGVEPLIYRLPAVIAGVAAGDEIWIAEGEKDCEALRTRDVVATCNSGGAGKFPAAMAKHLTGAAVIVVRDKDEPGQKHAQDLYRKLHRVANSIRIVEARKGHDAHDHLADGKLGLKDFIQVWPEPKPETDPVGWKRSILASSFTVTQPIEPEAVEAVLRQTEPPRWPSGLEGLVRSLQLQGVTLVSGAKGSGKSYLAIASSLAAAQAGWQVLYLSAEMSAKLVAQRAVAHLCGKQFCDHFACGKRPPASWALASVGLGANARVLCDHLSACVTDRKLLVVFDSLSSFVDQGIVAEKGTDAFGMLDLKRTLMWMVNVRRKSEGQVSFLALCELARSGDTRGNFADYKADLVLSIATDKKQNLVKEISIAKGWAAPVGKVGRFTLDVRDASLTCTAPENEQDPA